MKPCEGYDPVTGEYDPDGGALEPDTSGGFGPYRPLFEPLSGPKGGA